ncbi:MAG: DUF2953 domain-containing protein [Oscillospiraceae bacterium]
MIVLKIVGAVFLIIVLLTLLPIGVKICYNSILTVDVRYLFLKFRVYPMKSKKKKEPKQIKAKKKQSAKTKVKKTKSKEKTQNISETIEMVLDILRALPKAIKLLLKSFCIYDLQLTMTIGREDAHQTALTFGKMSAYIYSIFAVLNNIFKIKVKSMVIQPDFYGEEKNDVNASVKIVLIPIIAIIAAIYFAVAFLKDDKKTYTNSKEDTAV